MRSIREARKEIRVVSSDFRSDFGSTDSGSVFGSTSGFAGQRRRVGKWGLKCRHGLQLLLCKVCTRELGRDFSNEGLDSDSAGGHAPRALAKKKDPERQEKKRNFRQTDAAAPLVTLSGCVHHVIQEHKAFSRYHGARSE